jgi:hypothetical protein
LNRTETVSPARRSGQGSEPEEARHREDDMTMRQSPVCSREKSLR